MGVEAFAYLHENVRGEVFPGGLGQPCHKVLIVQVVPTAFPLRLEHVTARYVQNQKGEAGRVSVYAVGLSSVHFLSFRLFSREFPVQVNSLAEWREKGE